MWVWFPVCPQIYIEAVACLPYEKVDRFYRIIAIENRTMKAVIFATQIVLMLIISSAYSAQVEFEPGQYQEIIAAAQVDEDAKENSHGIYECIVE